MTNYPRDEFDRVPEFSNRHGTHRAAGWAASASSSGGSGLRWLMITGVFALCVGLFSFLVLPGLLGAAGADAPPQSASPSATPATPKKPKKSAAAMEKAESTATASSDAPEKPGESVEPSATPSGFDPLVNENAPIGVYNASTRGGLAGLGTTKLTDAGFTQSTAGNWTKKANTSAVYYRQASSKATAEAAAEALGITLVLQTSNIPGEIAVVLGGDFSG